MMNRLAIAAAAVVFVSRSAVGEAVSGPAKAIGGDLIEVAGKQFYLNGVVAPKGAGAQFALESLLGKGMVSCTTQKVSQGSKPTAVCKVGSKDLSVELVSVGAGVAYEENGVDLIGHALQVKPNIEGLDDGLTPPRDCVVKGNKSYGKKSVDKIYHMPGDPHYLRTKIDVSKGEAWFCSADEAEAAGFRRAGE